MLFRGSDARRGRAAAALPGRHVAEPVARAREKLRISLIRGGVILPSAAIGSLLMPRSVSASVPSILCDSTARAAIHFTARHAAGGALSAPAAELARQVLRIMLLSKIKLGVVSLLLVASAATSAGLAARSLGSKDDSAPNSPVPKLVARAADPPAPAARPPDSSKERMFVTGRVLDPQAKPVPNAAVAVYGEALYSVEADWRPSLPGRSELVLAQGHCDESGHFHIDTLRTSSSRYKLLGVVARRRAMASPGLLSTPMRVNRAPT